MTDYYSPDQAAVIDRDNRNMFNAGIAMSVALNDLWATLSSSGQLGITSAAADIDSLALGGGAFTPDYSTSNGSTLDFSWKTSRFHNGKSLVVVPGGTITLAAAATNYVEVSRAGVVSSNTTGFTAGRLPLYVVTTSGTGWVVANVVSAKALMTLIGANGVDGSMLSVAAGTKEVSQQLGAIANTGAVSFLIPSPNVAATLIAAVFTEGVAVAQSDANYWTWTLTNLGQAGVGTNAMLSAAATNTTKATGGAALVAAAPRTLVLHGVPGTDTNLNTAPNDVLQLTLTPTGTPTALTAAALRLDFGFTS